MAEPGHNNVLRSWKEIAAYLGYGERTCIRWEQKYGMPVHRPEKGAPKSPVVAYKDELDAWFKERFKNSKVPLAPEAGGRPVPRRLWFLLVPVLAAAAFLWIRTWIPKAGQPADFHLRGSVLVIVDNDGGELWRRDTGVEGLWDEAKYRDFFQVARRDIPGQNLPWIAIRDIDGDGRNEVLFAVKRTSDALGEGILICFDSRGAERWRFRAGREMVYGGRAYSPDYRIHGFKLYDFNRDGRQEIIVSSFYFPWEPCQLAILDAEGNLLGEFWNAGYLTDIAFGDLDGDGRDEMYAAGVNNEYGGGCLVVFDPGRVRGASPQTPRFSFSGVEPGSEKYYIDFPRSDVSLAAGGIVAGNFRVEAMSNRRLRVVAHKDLMYEFGPGMRCLNVSGGHGFITAHTEFAGEGKVRSTLDDAYYEARRRDLRYWDGSKWVPEPAPNLRNVRPVK